jgi:RND family efflux transporter MFP subunit
VFAVALMALVVLPFAQATYRIGTRATLEGVVVRTLAAPFDGYVEQARFRAGDAVKAGTEIATLDRRDLRLELIRTQGQVDQYREQYNDASARRDRAQMAIAQAQMEQAAAQAQLTQDNLARSAIQAPFDGLIVSGDLHQQLGAGVRRGQTLFEIAPLDRYRVVLEVPDAEIDDVRVGQVGTLRLAALPERVLAFKVDRVTPVTTARDGATYFRVEADLEASGLLLRPGMMGTAKIEAGTQPLGWIWLHPFVDWLRLHLGGWL